MNKAGTRERDLAPGKQKETIAISPLALGNFIEHRRWRCSMKFLWANGQES